MLTTHEFSKVYIIFDPGNVRLPGQQLLSLVIKVVVAVRQYLVVP